LQLVGLYSSALHSCAKQQLHSSPATDQHPRLNPSDVFGAKLWAWNCGCFVVGQSATGPLLNQLRVVRPNKMVDPGLEYNPDNGVGTSDVNSQDEELYPIKGILSEGRSKDKRGNDITVYLIEWENYPMEE
jgi:hypothetical protein